MTIFEAMVLGRKGAVALNVSRALTPFGVCALLAAFAVGCAEPTSVGDKEQAAESDDDKDDDSADEATDDATEQDDSEETSEPGDEDDTAAVADDSEQPPAGSNDAGEDPAVPTSEGTSEPEDNSESDTQDDAPPAPSDSAATDDSEQSSADDSMAGGAPNTPDEPTDDTSTDVDPTEPTDPDAPVADCSAIANHAGWQLCESGPGTCTGIYTETAGCEAFCASVGMTCVEAWVNLEDSCGRDTSYDPLSCSSGHESDFCACGGSAPATPDVTEQPDDSGPAYDCSAIAAHEGWELCASGPDRCEAKYTANAGCPAVCESVGLVCVEAWQDVEGQCAPNREGGTLSCTSGHESDYCVCGPG